MTIYIVTGTPGVGKTTVLNGAIKGTDIKIVTFGDIMFDIAREEGLVKVKDEIRSKIGLEKYGKIQEKALERIVAMKGDIVVDTHASMKKPEGYYPGLPEHILKRLNPKVIVAIEANPSEIATRRKEDPTRHRADFGGVEETIEYQNINRAFIIAYAAMVGCPVKIIVNEQGKMDKAAKELREVFK